jgi:hypothetical protein
MEKFAVSKLEDITPENLRNVKLFAEQYQPPKKGKK